MKSTVMIIEDDERIRTSLKIALQEEGYGVDAVGSGEEALVGFHEKSVDVVLLDIMLPGIDGFECCRQIRKTSNVPVVMVTARLDTHDIVAGLEAGADDYVTKPFVLKELTARIRALLRRTRLADHTDTMSFGKITVYPEEGIVTKEGADLHCTKTEFRLMCELIENAGKVLSRDQLLDRVWGYDYFADGRLVDVHVRRLRIKIEDDPANPVHLVTVRGLGYKLVT
ncbi:MAG: response regulator transcription factor [Actinobacteria bacterium]|jgi:DNA-binding response OmpR family regulator|nr:response regulator transcription factor [Actinomycetota bacterium]